MPSKVVRFPDRGRRKRDRHRHRIVECEVSVRWLQFAERIDRHADKDYLRLDVMTRDANEQPRKLCSLVVDSQELVSLLESLPVKDWRRS